MTHRAVNIVATVGPASTTANQLTRLIEAGVDVFRFNFAHGTREEHARSITLVHELARQVGRPIGTLADLSGPKIRLGKIPVQPYLLEPGQKVKLSSSTADPESIPVQLDSFCDYVQPGDPVYLADGTRKLIVRDCIKGVTHLVVEVGGEISSYKGINLPNLRKPLPAVSEKDLIDLEFALQAGVDWIGLSFVSCAEDLLPARDNMEKLGIRRPILAKLERRRALDRLDEIMQAFDGVMVARGDLGIEVEFEKVPTIQDRILRTAQKYGKPAIVATQILTSMVTNPRPTRAEVTDIAYAVTAGADALMLSEETAIGKYPVEAVETIAKVAHEIESTPDVEADRLTSTVDEENAIAHTAVSLAHDIGASAIFCSTRSGVTAKAVARFRPHVPIIVISDNPEVIGILTLYRGVFPRYATLGKSFESRILTSLQFTDELGLNTPGAKFVIVGGLIPGSRMTDLIHVHTVSSDKVEK